MKQLLKLNATLAASFALSLAISGCNRSESPEKTHEDVTKAEIQADKDVAEARQKANDSTIGARSDLDKAQVELKHENSEARRDVTIAEAQANRKIKIEKCEALTGDLRSACKTQADADLESAKAYAKADQRASDPKP